MQQVRNTISREETSNISLLSSFTYCLFLQTWKEKYRQPFHDGHATRINRCFDVKDSLLWVLYELCRVKSHHLRWVPQNAAELSPQGCFPTLEEHPAGVIRCEYLDFRGVNWLTWELQSVKASSGEKAYEIVHLQHFDLNKPLSKSWDQWKSQCRQEKGGKPSCHVGIRFDYRSTGEPDR